MPAVVVMPVFKKDDPLEDILTITEDKSGMVRPLFGKSEEGNYVRAAQQLSEDCFGLHGFVDNVGAVHLSGDTIAFYALNIMEELPSTKKGNVERRETTLREALSLVRNKGNAMNLFYNMIIRLYAESRGIHV